MGKAIADQKKGIFHKTLSGLSSASSPIYDRYNSMSLKTAKNIVSAGMVIGKNIVGISADIMNMKSYARAYYEAALQYVDLLQARRITAAKMETHYKILVAKYNANIATAIIKLALSDVIGGGNLGIDSDKFRLELDKQEIPLADGDSEQNAVKLLKYLCENGLLNAYGYTDGSIIEYMQQNNLYLIVEPITWVCPAGASGSPNLGRRVYGTLGNLYIYHQQIGYDMKPFQYTLLSSVGGNCMSVGSIISFGDIVITPFSDYIEHSISESAGLVNSSVGYGMHIYTVFASAAGTHTWDKQSCGSNPGPAPDPTNLSDEVGPDGRSLKRYTIVKYYEDRDENGNIIQRSNFTRENNPPSILIEDEAEYKVESWHSTPDGKKPASQDEQYYNVKQSHSNTEQGNGPGSVILQDNDQVLHVLLVRTEKEPVQPGTSTGTPVNGDYILTESEISKYYTGGETMRGLEVTYSLSDLTGCDGHTIQTGTTHHNAELNEEGETIRDAYDELVYENKACDFTLSDSVLRFVKEVTNLNSFLNYIASGSEFDSKIIDGNDTEYNRTTIENQDITASGYDYGFVLYRGDDKLTLAGSNLLESSNALSALGYSTDIVSGQTRKKTSYTGNIIVKLTDIDSQSDYVTSSTGTYGCEHSYPVDGGSIGSSLPDFNAKVAINVYSGTELAGSVDQAFSSGTQRYPLSGYEKVAGSMVRGKEIDFFPVIAMTYETMESHTKTIVAVEGEYVRGLIPNYYAEVAWGNENGGILNVSSQQWSVHNSAVTQTQYKPWAGQNQVLPGGAIYALDTKGSEQKVVLNTYQPILVGESLESALACGLEIEDYSEPAAMEAHMSFVEEAAESLETLNLVQYVNPKTDVANAWKGESAVLVYPGAELKGMANTKAGSDSKYYLKEDEDNSSQSAGDADLDVEVKGTRSTYYRIYSDYKGNILLAEGNTAAEAQAATGTVILSKGQGASALKGGSGAKARAYMLDLRTGIVTKYVAAIERNSGNDPTASWAPDGKWYNEAWSGVIIMVTSTELQVGLSDPATRTTVLDPNLCPESKGTSDRYSRAYVTQYKTASMCSNRQNREEGYIGTFRGTAVIMEDMDMLFTSRKFYIPNVNVQDLN